MAYIELDSALFRGKLKAATGVAKFRLTANAINAVDTVNIGNDQVTYNKYINVSGFNAVNGKAIMTLQLDVPDDGAWIEIIAYAARGATVTISGSAQINRNRRGPSTEVLPFITVAPIKKGIHIVQMIAGSSGITDGYIIARYIRTTGA